VALLSAGIFPMPRTAPTQAVWFTDLALHEALKAHAVATKTSMTTLVQDWVREHLGLSAREPMFDRRTSSVKHGPRATSKAVPSVPRRGSEPLVCQYPHCQHSPGNHKHGPCDFMGCHCRAFHATWGPRR